MCIKGLRLVTVQLPEKFLGRRTATIGHPREHLSHTPTPLTGVYCRPYVVRALQRALHIRAQDSYLLAF
jgi:hypothetical protein